MTNETKPQHTPTPWRLLAGTESIAVWSDKTGRYIMIPSPQTRDHDEQIANAAFIVRAVNSHDAMLAALKNLRANVADLPTIIQRGGCMVGDKEVVESMRAWIDEAIRKGEEK